MNIMKASIRVLLLCFIVTICGMSCRKSREITRIDYQSGGYYIGEISEGRPGGHGVRPDGHGVLFCPNGAVYVGEWKKGEQNGFGCEFNTNLTHNMFLYAGEYKRSLKRGKGMMMQDNILYLGEWSVSSENARGIMIETNSVSFGVSEMDYIRKTKGQPLE